MVSCRCLRPKHNLALQAVCYAALIHTRPFSSELPASQQKLIPAFCCFHNLVTTVNKRWTLQVCLAGIKSTRTERRQNPRHTVYKTCSGEFALKVFFQTRTHMEISPTLILQVSTNISMYLSLKLTQGTCNKAKDCPSGVNLEPHICGT